MSPYTRYRDMPIQQIIPDRYIDANKLQDLLAHKFPPNQYCLVVSLYPLSYRVLDLYLYTIQWKINRWIITVPERLSEVQASLP